jgi:hypothetical protein
MQTNLLTHGSLSALPASTALTAGALNMLYENGFLRYIYHGPTEIVRMINLTVRDHNWKTIPLVIVSERIESSLDSFFIEYDAQCVSDEIDFRWKCSIRGNSDSTITFTSAGKALTAFKRNRVGFTVLHPIETCSGKSCLLSHPGGKTETQTFPVFISPHQPFIDLTSMAWEPAEGVKAALHFEGDLFETEDQRNWLDVSYKTYCTPLSNPFPVVVNIGDEVNQTIRLHVDTPQQKSVPEDKPITFTVDKSKLCPFPKVGIPLSNQPHTDKIVTYLKALPVDFLRVELHVDEKGYEDILYHTNEVITKLNCPLEVVLFADEQSTTDFIQLLLPLANVIHQFIILPSAGKCTDTKLISRFVPILRKHFPGCTIGGGTDADFTELNRRRTPAENLDFLTFSVNPQAHATDLRTLAENMKGHRYVMESCREFSSEKGIHVGPVTLKMRRNLDATAQVPESFSPEGLPIFADPRQLSLFAAGWTIGSFKYLAENQAEAITYFQTCGWAGLMTHPNERWPRDYEVPEDCVYPVYLLLKELLLRKDNFIMPLTSTHPLIMDGVAFINKAGKETILLANLSPDEQHIQFPLKGFTSRTIDADNSSGLMEGTTSLVNHTKVPINNSITLPPFALLLADK